MADTRDNSSFLQDVGTLASGTTVAQLVAVASAPVLTRLFPPSAFGTFELFLSVATLVVAVASLRYDFAIVLPERQVEAVGLLRLSLLALVAVCVATAGAALLVPAAWAQRFLGDEWAQVVWLVPAFVLVDGFLRVVTKWTTRRGAFAFQAGNTLLNTVATVGIRIALGVLGFTSGVMLIVGGVGGSAVAAIAIAVWVWRDVRRVHEPGADAPGLRALAHRYRKFPLYTGWSAWAYTAAINVPAMLLFSLFSPAAAGYYAIGERVFRRPLNVVGQATAQVFFKRASDAHRSGELGPLVLGVHRTLAIVGLFPALLVVVFGEPLFTLVLGAQWGEAGVYAQILSVQVFFQFLSTPMGRLFYVLERQEANAVFSVSLLVVRGLALAVGAALGDVHSTLWLLAVSSTLVFAGFSYWIARVAEVSTRDWVAALGVSALRSVVVLAPAAVWVAVAAPAPGAAAAGATACAVAYAVWLWRREPLAKTLLSRLRGR